MKNDELVEHLHENHRVRILTENNGETSHQIDGYSIKKSESLKKQGWEGGKTKATWVG